MFKSPVVPKIPPIIKNWVKIPILKLDIKEAEPLSIKVSAIDAFQPVSGTNPLAIEGYVYSNGILFPIASGFNEAKALWERWCKLGY